MNEHKPISFLEQIKSFLSDEEEVKNITLQITENCNLSCSYCYQIQKSHKKMDVETGKAIIDSWFQMSKNSDNPIINDKTKGLVIEFIGGEPFLEIDLIETLCDYYIDKCLKEQSDWIKYTRFCITSNGILYNTEKVQHFLKKFHQWLSLNISIDGPKDIHDACRCFSDGSGSFDVANAADKQFINDYPSLGLFGTKATISPQNLIDIYRIIEFFVNEQKQNIFINPIFEHNWTIDQAQTYYNQLKNTADYLLNLDKEIYISLFNTDFFCPIEENDLDTWCGGNGKMLAYNTDGVAFPCLRFMESSLGSNIKPIIIGDKNALLINECEQNIFNKLSSINRRTKNDDECFNCPIAKGCSDCEGWNYQSANGILGIKNKNICWMHRAASLANVYFWNKYYKQHNIDKKLERFLPDEIALKIISQEELNMIDNLIK